MSLPAARFTYLFVFSLLGHLSGFGQPRTDGFLTRLLATNTTPIMQEVLRHPETYRLQLIYTQIDRDKHNKPSFRHYYFHVDSAQYVNPASTVKLPAALLGLEKINRLTNPAVTKFTAMQTDSAYQKQTRKWTDSSAQSGYPSIAQFIRKAFLVSKNDPYSRLYEFIGQSEFNRSLHAKGYSDTRITHRFVRMSADENRHINPVRFIRSDGSLIYAHPAAYNTDPFDFRRVVKLGKGYMTANDSLVNAPFDFTERNNLPLESLHRMLQSVMFPESVPAPQRFDLTPADYRFVYQYL